MSGFTCLARILDTTFYNVFVFTTRQYLFVTLHTDLVHNRDQFNTCQFPRLYHHCEWWRQSPDIILYDLTDVAIFIEWKRNSVTIIRLDAANYLDTICH